MGLTARRVVAGTLAAWTASVFVVVCLAACGGVSAEASEHACCRKPAGADRAALASVAADCCAQPAMLKPATLAMPLLNPGVALAYDFHAAPMPLAVASVHLPPPPGASHPFVLRV